MSLQKKMLENRRQKGKRRGGADEKGREGEEGGKLSIACFKSHAVLLFSEHY